jgi:hypothetical protein
MSAMDFDRHESVNYKPISALYWGEYPYKVVISYPKRSANSQHYFPVTPGGSLSRFVVGSGNSIVERVAKDRRKRNNFLAKLKKSCLSENWKVMDNQAGFSFFFKSKEEALDFIDLHTKHIREVFRPDNDDYVNLLLSDTFVIIRKSLFWNKFEWSILFKRVYDQDALAHIDHVITNRFEEQLKNKDAMYLYEGDVRRLYLKDEMDIYLTKLALGQHIHKIHKAYIDENIDASITD